ncbi:MMPL family transporter [Streptomyces lydicus]|nr:MMPL family transporter [Streptomyces lydicus]
MREAVTATGRYEGGRRVGGECRRCRQPAGRHRGDADDDARPAVRAGRRPGPRGAPPAVPGPAHLAGWAAQVVDARAALTSRLAPALALIAAGTLTVVFLFTRSVLIPLKVLAVAALSLTAALGGVVHVFQDGHLHRLLGDFTVTGTLDMTIPLLLFSVAFGLSVDYELFLLSRIQEHYRATGDNTAAVVHGIARTGRLFTAAALAVAVATGALATSGVLLLKELGFGLALAVLVDATVVRGVLVPAVMRLAGRANWWAPARVRPGGAGDRRPRTRAREASRRPRRSCRPPAGPDEGPAHPVGVRSGRAAVPAVSDSDRSVATYSAASPRVIPGRSSVSALCTPRWAPITRANSSSASESMSSSSNVAPGRSSLSRKPNVSVSAVQIAAYASDAPGDTAADPGGEPGADSGPGRGADTGSDTSVHSSLPYGTGPSGAGR